MNNLGRGESMRLSELSGKEIVNLERAEKMGVLGYVDLEVDEKGWTNTGSYYTCWEMERFQKGTTRNKSSMEAN